MIRGLMKTTSRLAVAGAAGLVMGGVAHAGGAIGGNCCADLEERVAELEATTVRKGNRKVSLTVYGQVNKAVLSVDSDFAGRDTDGLIIIDNGLSQSRFGLKGKAAISSDLYAGYKIEFGVAATTGGDAVNLRHNELYIGSKTFGRLTIGHGSTATDGISEIDLSGTAVAGGSDNLGGFENLDGGRAERIRYDSPTIAGFKVSAAFDENDNYDVALRYGTTYGNFTVAAGIGYTSLDDATDTEVLTGSASVMHNPTGLNLTFAAGEYDETGSDSLNFWYVKGGIKRRYFAAGSTALSVDYHVMDLDGGGEADKIGVQFVQSVDSAAMDLYASFWSTDVDDTDADESAFMAGARIKF